MTIHYMQNSFPDGFRIRRLFSLLVFLFAVALAPVAQAEDNTTGPQQLVRQTTDKMLAALKKDKPLLDKEPSRIYGLVKKIVVPHFDFVRMSKWVLGKNWRRASKEQKKRFIKTFRTLMVRTYAVALLDYTDQEIKYLPLRDDPANGDVTVRTEVLQQGQQPVTINYSLLRNKKDVWKVYDVAVNGVSLIANYRTSFATEVKKSSIDALIERLEKHNKKGES